MRQRALLLLLILTVLVAACAAPRSAPSQGTGTTAKPADGGVPPAAQPAPGLDHGYELQTTSTDERMIIYTASLFLIVRDTEASVDEIRTIAESFGGYVAQTEFWRDDGQLRGKVTIRVDSKTLSQALDRLRGIATRVERESSNSQDVTEEYTDLDARLRNLEATEAELLELLKTVRERTGKAEDILAVHQRLSEIRGQIEQIKGRMQYLETTSRLATVTVELIPDVLTKPLASAGWQPAATLSNALRALVSAMQSIIDAAIWVAVYVVPILVVLLVPFVLLWLVWRGRRKKDSRAAS